MPQKRNRRSGIEDRWTRGDGTPSAAHGKGLRWRARSVDDQGREHAKGFGRRSDATAWLDGQTSAIVTGTHVAPRDATITVAQWCDIWLAGYAGHRPNTVAQAKVYVRRITAEFGDLALSSLRPSQIKAWLARLQAEGLAASYIAALHKRLSQICADAVHDGLLGRNPCSRRTSPPAGKAKVYVLSTEQVWAIHDAVPEHLQAAVLLGAFAGLRISEVCGLRVTDVDFMRGVITPAQQWGGAPLKSEGSAAPIPIPRDLALLLAASVQRYGGDAMVSNGLGRPCRPKMLQLAMVEVREHVEGLPETFTFHDFRHYLASLLIASGADIKTLQARLRHASATTTLDVYGHLWPDADESTRAAVAAVIRERPHVAG
jgi:integrase